MAFQRIGTPVELDLVDFESAGAYAIVCKHCGAKVGNGHKRMARFSGTKTVVILPREFLCPKCGKTSPIVKSL